MRVTIITIGSHGDVLPSIAIAKSLIEHGHKVRIAALESSKEAVISEGIDYLHLSGDAKEVIRLLIGKDVKTLEYFKSLNTLLDPMEHTFLEDIERCCEDTDIVAYSVLGSIAYHVAISKKIPCIRMLFVPLDPTSEFPAMTAPILGKFPLYNRFTYLAGDYLWLNFTKKRLNKWRKKLGLSVVKKFPYRKMEDNTPVPTLYAFSESVLNKPKDWGKHIEISGYWFSDESKQYEPTESIKEFLQKNKETIYIGFGSMVGGDFSNLFSKVIKGVQLTGVSAIISSGWGGLSSEKVPDTIMMVDYVPHDWLFNQVSMVVHHGGAGTIAAGLRAGKPTIVVPFGGDQPFWGNQIYKIGAGPKPIPIKSFNSKLFAKRIKEVQTNNKYKENAARIKEILIKEDGKERAVRFIESCVRGKEF